MQACRLNAMGRIDQVLCSTGAQAAHKATPELSESRSSHDWHEVSQPVGKAHPGRGRCHPIAGTLVAQWVLYFFLSAAALTQEHQTSASSAFEASHQQLPREHLSLQTGPRTAPLVLLFCCTQLRGQSSYWLPWLSRHQTATVEL
jgi:hypothetical protein